MENETKVSISDIQARFLEGYNEDCSGKYSALTYRADVGYLLGIISNLPATVRDQMER